MANALTPLSPTYWSKIMGRKLFKSTIYRSIASFREEATLKDGQTVDRPYRSDLEVEDITRGTALNQQDISTTSDTLTVDKYVGMLFNVDKIDKAQNKWDAARVFAEDAAKKLALGIDASVLYQGINANDTVDYNDVDNTKTAGLPTVITAANVYKLFTIAGRKLDNNNVGMESRFAVITPEVKQYILEYYGGKETSLGDKTSEYGNIGRSFGFELYLSNNVTGSGVWTPVNNPTAAATVTIEGVVFAIVAAPSAAGDIDLGADLATTLSNLAALINAGGVGDGTANISVTTANQRKMRNWVAVATATEITVYVKGTPTLTVATSEVADLWSHMSQHNVFGQKGAIDVVTQIAPTVEFASRVSAGILGTNALPHALYATKLFYDEKNRVVDVLVDSENF